MFWQHKGSRGVADTFDSSLIGLASVSASSWLYLAVRPCRNTHTRCAAALTGRLQPEQDEVPQEVVMEGEELQV